MRSPSIQEEFRYRCLPPARRSRVVSLHRGKARSRRPFPNT